MAVMRNMDPKKCPMPSQDPNVRNRNFDEVALGYTFDMAVKRKGIWKALIRCCLLLLRFRLSAAVCARRRISAKVSACAV